jgi:hypothetical protein
MLSYIYRRQLTPSQTRESLDEVRARLIEELRLRTEERVNHWKQLGDWCKQRPGRYISVDWRPDKKRSSSSSAVGEATAGVTAIRFSYDDWRSQCNMMIGCHSVNQVFNMMIGGHSVNAHTVLYASYPKVAECPQLP